MFISPELAAKRLNDPSNIVNKLLDIGLSRDIGGVGSKEIPDSAPVGSGDEAPTIGNDPIEQQENTASAGDSSEPRLSLELGPKSEPKARITIGRNRAAKSVKVGESAVVNRNRHGRIEGATELDPMEKEIIGTLSRIDGPAAAAAAFQVAPSTAFNLGNGNFKKDEEVKSRIERNLGRVRDSALSKLLDSLELIDDDKLESLGAKDLSTVASNLSRVVEKSLPRDMQQAPTAQLIVYAPTIAKEEHYETVVLER